MTLKADDIFFPEPVRQIPKEGSLAPQAFPGITPTSTKAIQRILKDNHERHHVFFNERGFHNHIVHTTLTLWCLGADEGILQRSYEEHSKKQRPAFASPDPITKENWIDHLGDENFYQAYIHFFKVELELRNFRYEQILEEYIFSPSANFIDIAGERRGKGKQPEMMCRFFDNLFHPMIHTGFGIEFGVPGVFVEGLAQAAMHPPTATTLFPRGFFEDTTPSASFPTNNIHALSILTRVLKDSIFDLTSAPDNIDIPSYYSKVVKSRLGDAIRVHASLWLVANEADHDEDDANDGKDDDDNELKGKIEELIWTTAVIYGVGGMSEGNEAFNADFFLMHLVTSSIFLHTISSHLTRRPSRIKFLRGYLSVVLAWYVGRGRPELDIPRFFEAGLGEMIGVPRALRTTEDTDTNNINPHLQPHASLWTPILRSALQHTDDHVPKLHRALADHAARFISIPRGKFTGTELDDAGLIDGTLFVRSAGLTCRRLGWDVNSDMGSEGEQEELRPQGEWDRRAFFKQAKAENLTLVNN